MQASPQTDEARYSDQARLADSVRENERLARAVDILFFALTGVLASADTVRRVGTAPTIEMIYAKCDEALRNAIEVLTEPASETFFEEEVFCTRCQSYLTHASQTAGYCIKCEGR